MVIGFHRNAEQYQHILNMDIKVLECLKRYEKTERMAAETDDTRLKRSNNVIRKC